MLSASVKSGGPGTGHRSLKALGQEEQDVKDREPRAQLASESSSGAGWGHCISLLSTLQCGC